MRQTSNLGPIGEKVRDYLSLKQVARERALQLCRQIILNSSASIRAIHQGEYDKARVAARSARDLLIELNQSLSKHPDLLHSGFIRDAQKEYVEAAVLLALVSGEVVPDPDELGMPYVPYLNGLGEVVGELRRQMLDRIRGDELERCEELLKFMEDIYALLMSVDFPDALTANLRRTTDMVRGVLERSRGDLTLTLSQKELEKRLEGFQRHLKPKEET